MRRATPMERTLNRRTGFTLAEMLLVIAIIAVLIAMLLPAIFSVRRKAKETETRTEIAQLSAAIQAFQAHYRVNYVPSWLLLCENEDDYLKLPGGDQHPSYLYLKRLWPRLKFPVDWNGNGPTSDPPAILEGDQCLVFFLGGIPGGSPAGVNFPGRPGPPQVLGFSTTPANPAQPGGPRAGPFFQFDHSRLVHFHPPTVISPGQGFYSYQDPYRNRLDLPNSVYGVYAYMSAYGRMNGYMYQATCAYIGVGPYADFCDPYNPHFLNPKSFQIISPGADGRFGGGSAYNDSTQVTAWSPGTASTSGALEGSFSPRDGADDISNFYDRPLGVSE